VLAYLDRAKLKYCPDPYIVRGLDYYTGTVFEVSHEGLGAQDAIGAGGRYDSLISDLGGPGLGATGFALGIERIIMAAAKQGIWALRDERRIVFPIVYIATMGEDARNSGLELMGELRGRALADEGSGKITFTMDYENKSLKAQMREADKMLARVVLIIGEDELKDNKVTIKDMKKKDAQVSADRGLVMPEVRKILC
jgi:histidyl-tRNA synthetase